MKTILVTRPETEAAETGHKLEALGYHVLYAPMIKIAPVSFEIPDDTRTLVITSKNGARYGLANIGNKNRPIFAVGEQTADVARSLGFTNIIVGPGTARQLVPLLLQSGDQTKRDYSHLCGSEIAYNIASVLRDAGFDAENIVTYQSLPNRSFPPAVQEAMEAGQINAVLFYSPRTATIFEEAISECGFHDWLPKLDAYCLSERVANELFGPWKSINRSVMPQEKALLSLLST